MATMLLPQQIAGPHFAAYDALYRQVDPTGSDRVGALEAAAFLKRSGLPDATLRTIWELADPVGKGFLDKRGLFVALKMVAVAQSGAEPNISALPDLNIGSPKMAQQELQIDWTPKPSERAKYQEIFNSLQPVNGMLPGSKVRPVMLNSKLPVDILGRIWDLSDQDQDGNLDEEEFIVAMHLVYKALLEKVPIPAVLPAVLVKKPSASPIPTGLPDFIPAGFDNAPKRTSLTSATPPPAHVAAQNALNALDRPRWEALFAQLDTDHDGLVTGGDCKDVFLKTGLPQMDLAHIWGVADANNSGMLDRPQFCTAMYLIQEKLGGAPPILPPVSAPVICGTVTPPPTGNKEIDALLEEIRQLQSEKGSLEQEVGKVEGECNAKQNEVATARRELENLEAMLRQLDMQKKEATKRLGELTNQRIALEKRVVEAQQQIVEEQERVVQLKRQVEEEKARIEEEEKMVSQSEEQLAQVKEMEEKVEEKRKELERIAAEVDSRRVELDTLRNELNVSEVVGGSGMDDPFVSQDPFAGEDPFKADPFASGVDPFAPTGGGAAPAAVQMGFESDPFGSDPFAPSASASDTPALPPKKSKAPPPRPAPPKQAGPPARPPGPTRAAPAPPTPPSSHHDDPFAPSGTAAPPASDIGFANFANFD